MEKAVELKSGSWRQRVTGPDGKRHSVTAPGPTDRKVKKAAALLLAQLEKDAAEKKTKKTKTLFSTYAEQHLWSRRPGRVNGYAPSAFYKRQLHLKELNKTFGRLYIEEIRPPQVRAWWVTKGDTPSYRQSLY
jgi:hypothetical protein